MFPACGGHGTTRILQNVILQYLICFPGILRKWWNFDEFQENNGFDVVITYTIIGADVPPQSLQFVLQPTR